MVVKVNVEGLDAFLAEAEKHKGKRVIALFSGSKNSSGQSWCPDCVAAEPVINKCIDGANLPDDAAVFIYCIVGDVSFWKDRNCVFRTHPRLKLKSIPTLIEWGTPKKLDNGCDNADLVNTLLEEN